MQKTRVVDVKNKQITVGELIKILRSYPADALVMSEGCDCSGPSNGIEYNIERNIILITRLEERI